jgi:hypothetical protein
MLMERWSLDRQKRRANLVYRRNKGTDAAVYSYGTRWKLSFSLGQYTTVFQAERHVIKACVVEILCIN